jgi:hypothetical protein
MNWGPKYLAEERVSSPKDLFFDWNQNVKERPFLESQPIKLQPAVLAHLFHELHIWGLASRQTQQVEISHHEHRVWADDDCSRTIPFHSKPRLFTSGNCSSPNSME